MADNLGFTFDGAGFKRSNGEFFSSFSGHVHVVVDIKVSTWFCF